MTGASQYLLVLYMAEQRDSKPIAPGDLAAALDRSPAATTEMLQRLDERGLVAHEPYEGATLTDDGREAAEDLYETYVVLSRFFDDVLDLSDHEREALELAGTISPTVTERLASTLLTDVNPGSTSDDCSPTFLPLNRQ
ncbi:MAG: metal-dependent transcriptional regulator [Halovenus sp.]